MKIISVKLLVFLCLMGCNTIKSEKKRSNYNVYKQKQLATTLKYAAQMHTAKFLSVLKQIKDTVTTQVL